MSYSVEELPRDLVKAFNLRLREIFPDIQLVISGKKKETKLNPQYIEIKTMGPLTTEGPTDDQITFVVRLECYAAIDPLKPNIYGLDLLLGKALLALRGPIDLGIQSLCIRPDRSQVLKRGFAATGTDLEVAIVEAYYQFELVR